MIPGVPYIPNFNLSPEAKRILLASALVIIGGVAYGRHRKNKLRKEAEAKMATQKSAGQAAAIRAALSTFGWDSWQWLTDDEKEEIFKIASEIEDLNAVYTEYSGLTEGRSLYADLTKVLEASDLQKFLSLASKGKVGTWYYAPKSDKVPANHWVITKLVTHVRSSPRNIHYTWLNHNIVKKSVPAGRVLGITTGKFQYDEPSKVIYVEFYTFDSKYTRKTYWVAKSQVEIISNDEYKKRKANKSISQEVIEGIGKLETEIENKKRVVSKGNYPVYNEQFKQTGVSSKNMVLGSYKMTLDTGKGKYIQFETIQGLLRWVRAEWAVIITE